MKVLKRLFKLILIFFLAGKVSVTCAQTPSFSEFKTIAINGATGNFSASNNVFTLSNSTANGGLFFAFQPFSDNGQIIARIQRIGAGAAQAGVMFRQNLGSNSLNAGTFLAGGNLIFDRCSDLKKPSVQTLRTNETPQWLRVVREGNAFSGFFSNDGTNWVQFSADSVEMTNGIFAGLAISGIGEAIFDQVRLTRARLTSPVEISSFTMPTNVLLNAEVASLGGSVSRVEFFSGTKKITETTAPPDRFLWTNVLAGAHSITAKVTDNSGAEFFTEPVNCEVKLPSGSATFLGLDEKTKGDWKGVYGKDGFLIVNDKTNFPAFIQLSTANTLPFTWTYPTNQSALLRADSAIRIASSWNHRHPMTLTLSLADGGAKQLALYFLDWDERGRIMEIQIWNTSGKMLGRQTVYSFIGGKYMVWRIRGKVIIKIASLGGGNPIVSGLFFDREK